MSGVTPLLFKAWRESRERFLLGAALLTAICVLGVFCRGSLMTVFAPGASFVGAPYVGYIYRLVYGGPARGLFCIMAMMLALGGLPRERLHRTAGFTLALPVSRAQLVQVQALLGLGQIAALSVLPLLLLAACSRLAQVPYPIGQLVRFDLLWSAGGALFFAVAFLAATVFRNEYAALAVSLVFMILYPLAVLLPPLNRYPLNIHHIMSGLAMPYFDARTALMMGAPSWGLLACMAAMAGALIVLALRIAQRQDYG